MKDFTFSNGLHIPTGTYIYTPNAPVLFDSDNYTDPEEFNGFRHYMTGKESAKSSNHSFVSTSMTNLQFGDGRHTW